jgi:hypothetical protein
MYFLLLFLLLPLLVTDFMTNSGIIVTAHLVLQEIQSL